MNKRFDESQQDKEGRDHAGKLTLASSCICDQNTKTRETIHWARSSSRQRWYMFQ